MTAPHIIDPAGLLGEALSEASPGMMRTLLDYPYQLTLRASTVESV